MSSLRIRRTMVEVALCNLIDRGQESVDKLVQVGSIKNCEEFQGVQTDHLVWSEQVLSCLSEFFEGGDEPIRPVNPSSAVEVPA